MTNTNFQKGLSLALFVLLVLMSLPILGAIAFFSILMAGFASDAGPSPWVPVVGLLASLPSLIPLGVLWKGWQLRRREKYLASIVLIMLAIVVEVCGYSLYIFWLHQEQGIINSNREISVAPSGFLMPGPNTVPAGFVETGHFYAQSGYELAYRGSDEPNPYNAGSPSYGAFDTLVIAEHAFNRYDAASGVVVWNTPAGIYARSIDPGVEPNDTKVLDFTYQGEPGAVYASVHNAGSGPVSYELKWNDHGTLLAIHATLVSSSTFSPQILVSMLESMSRS